jgi:putative ABC transport system ATP-binding protein
VPDLRLSGLAVEYERGGYLVRPIDGLDLHIADGQLVLLLGASGCGKTTLLSVMATLLTPARGTVHLGDTDVTALRAGERTRYRRHCVGVVFQAFNLIPSLTAVENVAMPLWAAGTSGATGRRRARALLEELGLGDRLRHRPGSLSGGQQQRVAVARALVGDPPLLLADEPTAHLDEEQVGGVIRILRRTAQPGRIVVVATHDERLVPVADRVVELSPRRRPPDRPPERSTLAAGEVLFTEGQPGEVAYVVEDGEVELVRQRADGGEDLMVRLGPGQYFGELAPLLGMPRRATARAASPATVLAYTPSGLRHAMAAGSPGADPEGRVAPGAPPPDV